MSARRQELLAALSLGVLALILFLPHILHGGFVNDDWANYKLVADGVQGSDLDHVRTNYAHRPIYVLYSPMSYWLFGLHVKAYLAYVAGLGWLAGTTTFLVLRRVGLPLVASVAVGAFMIVWPFSDSVRLWIAASGMSLAVAMTMSALLLARAAFNRREASAIAMHVVSIALQCLAILLFEVVAGLVLVSLLAYLRWTDPRTAAKRWVADLVSAGAVMLIWTLNAPTSYQRNSFGDMVDNAWRYAGDSMGVLGGTWWPNGQLHNTLGVVATAIAVGIVVAAWWDRDLRLWAAVVGGGVVLAAAGWLPFVAGDPNGYRPAFEGGQNRTNVTATIGVGLVVVGTLGAIAQLATRRFSQYPRAASALFAGLVAVVLFANAAQTRSDISAWDEASAVTEQQLRTLRATTPDPPQDTTFLVFGGASDLYPGIPILGGSVDTSAAVATWFSRSDLTGSAVIEGMQLVCDPQEMKIDGAWYVADFRAPYGSTIAVDLSTGRAVTIAGPEECEMVKAGFPPGKSHLRGLRRPPI